MGHLESEYWICDCGRKTHLPDKLFVWCGGCGKSRPATIEEARNFKTLRERISDVFEEYKPEE